MTSETTLLRPARLRSGQPVSPTVAWFAPQPLWRAIPRAQLPAWRERPFILRFARDDFMAQLQAQLASAAPEAIAALVAQPETWRAEDVGLDPEVVERAPEGVPFKLFQPAHMRFYLVAGALACRIPGLPDRFVDPGAGEQVFFVLRRVEGEAEYGWGLGQATAPAEALGAPGYLPAGAAKGWRPVPSPQYSLLADEERFPLFPLSFSLDGHQRRLLAGVVQVGSREQAPGAPPSDAESKGLGGDPRPILLEQQVVEPLRQIEARRGKMRGDAERRQVEHALAMALLDWLAMVEAHVAGPLAADLVAPGSQDLAGDGRYGAAGELAGLVRGRRFRGSDGPWLRAVLAALAANEEHIRFRMRPEDEIKGLAGLASWRVDGALDWLSYWVSLVDATSGPMVRVLTVGALRQPYTSSTAQGPLADYPPLPKLDPAAAERYVIRMVYERPQCRLPLLSAPTRAFAMAPFFDPDAPLRRFTIPMPVDTSTEGLRKYGPSVSFLLSDQLRRQMDRVKGLEELMKQELNDERELSLGLVCSFSIPIITICALILLLIIVSLLNIVFWWMPFFKICLPVPKVE